MSVTGSMSMRSVSRIVRYLRYRAGATEHGVRDHRAVGLDSVLDEHRRDVLAARGDDELLDAPRDREQHLAVARRRGRERPNVARAQVAVLVDLLGSLLGLVV